MDGFDRTAFRAEAGKGIGSAIDQWQSYQMSDPVILWFRQDLRLSDQAAFAAAVKEGPVIPVYILDDAAPRQWKIGSAQRCLSMSLPSAAR